MVMPGMLHEVKTDTLKPGDVGLVKPGEKAAADGIILEGESGHPGERLHLKSICHPSYS
jgi:cation transport ATPase